MRILKETKDFVELEVVVYPFNSNAETIQGNPNWKKDYAGMRKYLEPGVTTNWDAEMRMALLQELAKDGIDPDKLTDKEVVEQVSRWLYKRSQRCNMFCTFYVGFPNGKPEILPGMEKAFEGDKGDPKWTTQQQFDRELFGKQMFNSKTHGTLHLVGDLPDNSIASPRHPNPHDPVRPACRRFRHNADRDDR